jgi:hypothetical protein
MSASTGPARPLVEIKGWEGFKALNETCLTLPVATGGIFARAAAIADPDPDTKGFAALGGFVTGVIATEISFLGIAFEGEAPKNWRMQDAVEATQAELSKPQSRLMEKWEKPSP